MNRHRTRRDFLAAAAAAGMGLLAAGRLEAAPFKTHLHKAMTAIGKPSDDLLKKLKAAGFEGIEAPHNLTPDEARRPAGGRKAGHADPFGAAGLDGFQRPEQGRRRH